MFIYCEEKIIDTKQIHQLFYPEEEKFSKGVLHDFQYEVNSPILPKKKNNIFLFALSAVVLYTIIISFISITTYKFKNHQNISSEYNERKKIIDKELDKVLCNLFFSCLEAAKENSNEKREAVMAGLTSKYLHLRFYFKNFLEEYFNTKEEYETIFSKNTKIAQKTIPLSPIKKIKKIFNPEKVSAEQKDTQQQIKKAQAQILEKVTEKIKEFYWINKEDNENEIERKIEIVRTFFKNTFSEKIDEKCLTYPTLQKEEVMQSLIPISSEEIERASIDDIISLQEFQNSGDTFNIAKKIAEKLVLNSVFKKENFQQGINKTNSFLLFLQSLVEIDEEYKDMILAPKG